MINLMAKNAVLTSPLKNARSVENVRLLTSPLTEKNAVSTNLTKDAKSAVIVPTVVVTNLLSKSRMISLTAKNAVLTSLLKNAKSVATVRRFISLSTAKNAVSTNLMKDAKSVAGHPLIASLLTLTNVRAMQSTRRIKKNATVRKMGNAVV